MPIFHILSHHHQFNSKSNSHSQHGFNLNLSLSLNPNQKSNPSLSLSLSLILSLNMKSSYTSPDIENHYWSTKKERSNSRFGLILLWLLVLTSIFTFFTLYSPNPFNLIPKQERFNEWNSLLNKPITDEHDNCDLFKGRWIPDLNGPLYTNKSCPTMPDSKNCGKHGRKDVDYMNWRWKPDGCELPRFDHKKFFSMVKGKKMAFIGDSVARNQMESLLCLLSQEEMPVDIYKDSEDRYRTWYFPSHNFTLMVFWVKYLITGEERVINGSLSGFYDLYLDKIETAWTEKLPGLDYAIISDAHWFFRKLYLHDGDKLIGCVYCDEPNVTQISVSFAVQSAYRVALKYINECKECGNLISFVRTFAPAHFEYGTWNGGGICNRTSPYSEGEVNLQGSEWELRTSQVHQVKRAKKEAREKSTGKRFESLDITRAMVMRPDGHPGPHWDNQYMKGYNDCLHWCLPGPIDVWNDLLLAVLSKVHGLSLH